MRAIACATFFFSRKDFFRSVVFIDERIDRAVVDVMRFASPLASAGIEHRAAHAWIDKGEKRGAAFGSIERCEFTRGLKADLDEVVRQLAAAGSLRHPIREPCDGSAKPGECPIEIDRIGERGSRGSGLSRMMCRVHVLSSG
jgi:hypothetical protein